MMMGFQLVRDGYLARAGEDERELLGGLARDLIFILGSDLDQELQIRNESQAELEVSLEEEDDIANDLFRNLEQEMGNVFEQIEAEAASAENFDASSESIWPEEEGAFFDDALARLLPDMSEDPQAAAELRELTADSIANAKINNLVTFYQGITKSAPKPGSPTDYVMVSNEDAPAWVAAMNDIRIVLAARLGVYDDETAESVFARSTLFTSEKPGSEETLPEIETPEDMMTVLYSMLSWWQESLVIAIRNKNLRRSTS